MYKQQFYIQKADQEKHLVFGWASVAARADGSQVIDYQGDLWEVEDLEEAAYNYVLYFRDAGEDHLPELRQKAKLVESVVFTKEKMAAIGIPEGIIPEGWWTGFKVLDNNTWEKIKSGQYTMFSVEGNGLREQLEDSGFQKSRAEGSFTFHQLLEKNNYQL